ncbi:transcription elongation factor, mitochondrial isoform X2 [Monomorium pharaonis]|uniref:transcription elongation factor, mitochondrial isoform X2 n=1 Tax=Monomorium pharaonis TaxID=307658 RepID=UPI00063F2AAC|nr:transcription elongation factor, mitochondrial isoform X2 [Monomorium pharaonis]
MWNMMLTRFFNTIIKNQRGQIYKYWAQNTTIFKVSTMCTNAFDLNLLSPEDKEKILQVINSQTTKDLLQYSITKKRAEILELYRANNGPFESLHDLLKVKNMNNKYVYNFYKSILCGKKRATPKKIIRGLVVTPQNTKSNLKDINTVLGIHIGYGMISWSLLNRDCEVLLWNCKSLQWQKKENIHSLLQTVIPVARKLPKADLYIMQEIGGDVGRIQNRQFYQNFVQQSIIGAIILSYLTMSNSKFNDTTGFVTNNIFILRQHVLRKIYGLTIDNETISSQYMLQKLLQESDKPIKTKESQVLIRTELKDMYNAQSSIDQEQIEKLNSKPAFL